MKQMNVDPSEKIEMNFEAADIPKSVRIFQPVVFKKDGLFWCLLGPDFQKGIYGRGETVLEALNDWDLHLKERIKTPPNPDEDPVAQYVIDMLKTSVNDVW